MVKAKRKFLLSFGLIFSLLIASFCGFLFNFKLSEASTDDYILTVKKVATEVDSLATQSYLDGTDTDVLNISNGDFVILNNANLEPISSYFLKQRVLVSFSALSGTSLTMLETTATLNGVAIDTGEVITETEGSITTKSFSQYLDLGTLNYLNSTPIANREGLYSYTFVYRVENNGTIGAEKRVIFNFYLLNESSYLNPVVTENFNSRDNTETRFNNLATVLSEGANNLQTEPRFSYTERIDRSYYNNGSGDEVNYFNFVNTNSTNYDGSAFVNSTDVLQYPEFTYDAGKFNLSYTKTLYGELTTVTSSFSSINGVGTLTLNYTTSQITTTKTIQINEQADGSYIVSLTFDQIGDYNLSLNLLVNINGTYVTATTSTIKNEEWSLIGDTKLYVYGYQLYNSVYGSATTTEAEFKNSANGLYTDVSILNSGSNSTGITLDGNGAVVLPNGLTQSDLTLNSYTDNYDNLLCYTNQAPVYFKYYALLKYAQTGSSVGSFYNYYKNYNAYKQYKAYKNGEITLTSEELAQVSPITYNLTNSTRFTQNGYYQVFVLYTFEKYQYVDQSDVLQTSNYSTQLKIQGFAFSIANYEPTVTLQKVSSLGDVTPFYVGQFTNQNVQISWNTSNPFDVVPKVKIYKKEFTSTTFNDITSSANFLADNTVLFSNNGEYKIVLTYGPGYATSVTYRFTIDKTEISTVNFYSINDENTIGSTIGSNIISTKFLSYWTNKASGATISATYTFVPMSYDSTAGTVIYSGYKTLITNGFDMSTINNNLSYSTTSTNTGTLTSATDLNSILKNQGIYIFTFTDLAGNSITRAIMLENTNTTMILETENETQVADLTESNLVSSDTTLIWGSHKAILLDSNLIGETSISSLFASNIVSYNSNYYFIIPINQVKIDDYATGSTQTIDVQNSGNYITTQTLYASSGEGWNYGDNRYSVNVLDSTSYNTHYDIEMNLDHSLLMAYTTGAYSSTGTNSKQRLYNNQVTNRQVLGFDWIANTATEYEIASLVYDYYPLSYDITSSNYPYSQEPSYENVDILSNATNSTYNANKLMNSSIINPVTVNNVQVTKAGMYVVTRTYLNNISDNNGDTTVKTYTFFVDRTEIIDQVNASTLVGENIKVLMGLINQKEFGGSQFLLDYATSYLFETNRLPISISIPESKYSTNTDVTSDKLNLFTLNYKIANGTQTITDLSQLNNSGIYTVTIYDNTGYDYYTLGTDGSQVAHLNTDPIEYTFDFKVTNEKPTGNFIKNETEYLTTNSSSNSISVNTNNIKFVWNSPDSNYMAEIDENNLSITRYDINGNSTTILSIVNGVKSTATGYSFLGVEQVTGKSWDYEIDMSGLPLTSAKYVVNIQYKGSSADYGSNYSNAQTIYFDFVQPEYNYNNLLDADTYLTSTEKANFDNYNSNVNFENYAFVVSNSFEFTKNTDSSFWSADQDSAFIYYRKYDKYNTSIDVSNSYLNEQSLILEDSRYNDYTTEPTRLRFNKDLIINGQKVYNTLNYNTSFYEQMESVFSDPYGYYEIIEVDDAGNCRIYTVELKNPTENLEINYTTQIQNGDNTFEIETQTAFSQTETELNANNSLFEINDLINANSWLRFTVTNNDTNAQTVLTYSPVTNNKDNVLTQLNSIISARNMINGSSYTILIISNNLPTITINFRSPSQDLLSLSFTDTSQSFVVTLPSTESTYITDFKVYKAVNGIYEETLEYQVLTDSHSVSIVENPQQNTIYTYYFSLSGTTGGDYWFIFTDNFNRVNKEEHIIGITDVKTVSFSGTVQVVDDVTYTANQTYILYQPQLYQLSILKTINGITDTVNISNLAFITNADGTIRLTLFTQMPASSEIYYKITFTSSNGVETIKKVMYYSMLSSVTFKDSSDEIQTSLGSNGVTSKFIYIYFNSNETILPTYVTGILETTNGDEISTTNLGQISNGQAFTIYGKYTLTVYNALGVRNQLIFTIKPNVAVYYSVYAQVDGVNTDVLTPSSVKLSYNGQSIDNYFTIYNTNIEVNSAKKLIVSSPIILDSYTKIYTITSLDPNLADYSRTFAITTVPASTSFLGLNFKINGTSQTSTSGRFTNDLISVTTPIYNTFNGNLIYIDYYYNSQFVREVKVSELENQPSLFGFNLSDAGLYDIYVKDLAGNTAHFGTYSYFRIYLLNEILYSLNNANPLENAVYNGTVGLTVQQTSQYDSPKITINATLNGNPYTPTKTDGVYYFSDYGIYEITLEGSVLSQVITTTQSFTIINPNEARLVYEYTGSNYYEITSVLKDGIDITTQILSQMDTNSLNTLALSGEVGGIGGNGYYTITVQAVFSSMRPTQIFTFNVWINNQTTAIIQSSIDYGSTTTNKILISFNMYQIYSKIGDCTIQLNGTDWIAINSTTANNNVISYYELATNATYNISLVTSSGNTISSFVVTKVAPLNTVSIIVIVLGSVIVSGIIVMFVLLRKNMRVK